MSHTNAPPTVYLEANNGPNPHGYDQWASYSMNVAETGPGSSKFVVECRYGRIRAPQRFNLLNQGQTFSSYELAYGAMAAKAEKLTGSKGYHEAVPNETPYMPVVRKKNAKAVKKEGGGVEGGGAKGKPGEMAKKTPKKRVKKEDDDPYKRNYGGNSNGTTKRCRKGRS